MERIAVLDLGTNTAICSVMEVYQNSLIITYENSITTRIGQNLSSTRTISSNVLQRNVDILSMEFTKIYKMFGDIKAIGIATEALRSATNSRECINKIKLATKAELEIISGHDEAFYTLEAVKRLYDLDIGSCAVCDIGGGSTEVNILFNGKIVRSESLPLGVVPLEEEFNITNDFDNAKDAFERIKHVLGPIFERVDRLILCGGTGTTVAALMIGLTSYDPMLVEGYKFTSQTLDALLQNLLSLDIEDLKKVLITDTERADVITAGTLIMKVLHDLFSPKDFIITTIGPRHGFVINRLGLEKLDKITYRLS